MILFKYLYNLLNIIGFKTVTVVIFPGLGLKPQHYKNIIPNNVIKVINLNIWTNEELENIKRVGVPGSNSYNLWFEKIVKECHNNITKEIKNLEYKNINKIVYLTHSIGAEFAYSLKKYSDGIISYGYILKENDTNIPYLNFIGAQDSIVSKYTDKWPKNTNLLLNANHYSCSSNKGKKRSIMWRNDLGIPAIYEYYKLSNNKRIQIILKKRIYNFIKNI